MNLKRFFKWTAILGTILFVGVAFALRSMGKGLYEVGDVANQMQNTSTSPMASTSQHYWKVDRTTELFHFSQGAGKDLLVIHGGPGFPTDHPWKAAALLGSKYRFQFYHQRGCGLSTHPLDNPPAGNLFQQMTTVESQLGLARQIADIERIRIILGQDKLTLVGHSFGALIAALYASEFPQHVRAMILVSPANLVVFPKAGDDLFTLVGKRLPITMKDEYSSYMKRYFDFPSLFKMNESELSAFYGQFKGFYEAASGDLPQSQSPEAHGVAGGWMPLAVYLSMGQHHDYRSALTKTNAPVLVIHGANDILPESDSHEFASYFKNSSFALIQDAGHFSFDQQPVEFAKVVSTFLNGIPSEAVGADSQRSR
jgi:proline iminopeptidase